MVGDCLETLKRLPDESVHMCATSPPYWGLRDYGLPPTPWAAVSYSPMPGLTKITITAGPCCLGMERTPEVFAGHIVAIFREVRRVLRKDGTLWLNFGDSYCNVNGYARCKGRWHRDGRDSAPANDRDLKALLAFGLKAKDLVGIP